MALVSATKAARSGSGLPSMAGGAAAQPTEKRGRCEAAGRRVTGVGRIVIGDRTFTIRGERRVRGDSLASSSSASSRTGRGNWHAGLLRAGQMGHLSLERDGDVPVVGIDVAEQGGAWNGPRPRSTPGRRYADPRLQGCATSHSARGSSVRRSGMRPANNRQRGSAAGARRATVVASRVRRLAMTWPSPGSHVFPERLRKEGSGPPVGPGCERRPVYRAGNAHDRNHLASEVREVGQELQDVHGPLGIADQHDAVPRPDACVPDDVGKLACVAFGAGTAADHHGFDLNALRREMLYFSAVGDRVDAAAVAESPAHDENAQPGCQRRRRRRSGRRGGFVVERPQQLLTARCLAGGYVVRFSKTAEDLPEPGTAVRGRRQRAAGIDSDRVAQLIGLRQRGAATDESRVRAAATRLLPWSLDT